MVSDGESKYKGVSENKSHVSSPNRFHRGIRRLGTLPPLFTLGGGLLCVGVNEGLWPTVHRCG